MSSPDQESNNNEGPHALTITISGFTIPFDVITLLFAIIVASGGIMGYAKAQSVPSLVAGLSFGLIIAVGGYLEATYDSHWLTLAGALILGIMMIPRFMRSGNFMPAGLISLLSINIVLREAYFLYRIYMERMKSPSSQPMA